MKQETPSSSETPKDAGSKRITGVLARPASTSEADLRKLAKHIFEKMKGSKNT